MTTTLTIRLPRTLARKFKARARAERTTRSAVLREAIEKYVGACKMVKLNPLQKHIIAYAGKWDGDISGEELLRLTRP